MGADVQITFNFPPSGEDRATGLNGFPGTPIAENSIFSQLATPFSGAGTFFEEDPNSPEFDFGEQGTVAHTFYMDTSGDPGNPGTFESIIPTIQRGVYQIDSSGNICRILNSTCNRMKGGVMKVRIISEGLSWSTPPDEFNIAPQEINPDLFKHPRYNGSTEPSNNFAGVALTDAQKAQLRQALANPQSFALQDVFNTVIGTGGVQPGGQPLWPNTGTYGNPQQQMMAWELMTKNWRGTDTFYLPALVVTYTRFYPQPMQLNPGGYIEDNGTMHDIIPYSFWSLDGTDSFGGPTFSNSSLQTLETINAGNLYEQGVTYLRKSDTDDFIRTWHKITSTWIGAPTGSNGYIYWDPDLYSIYASALVSNSPGYPGPT